MYSETEQNFGQKQQFQEAVKNTLNSALRNN